MFYDALRPLENNKIIRGKFSEIGADGGSQYGRRRIYRTTTRVARRSEVIQT
jgi:hypothetical protein